MTTAHHLLRTSHLIPMPEAIACLFVIVVSLAAYIAARIHAANPANNNVEVERARLRHYRVLLQERLQLAQRENWGPPMLDQIFEELELTEAQLAEPTCERRETA